MYPVVSILILIKRHFATIWLNITNISYSLRSELLVARMDVARSVGPVFIRICHIVVRFFLPKVTGFFLELYFGYSMKIVEPPF